MLARSDRGSDAHTGPVVVLLSRATTGIVGSCLQALNTDSLFSGLSRKLGRNGLPRAGREAGSMHARKHVLTPCFWLVVVAWCGNALAFVYWHDVHRSFNLPMAWRGNALDVLCWYDVHRSQQRLANAPTDAHLQHLLAVPGRLHRSVWPG